MLIPRSLHALIDYIYGIVLIGIPYFLGFAWQEPARMVFWAFGFGAILYSLLTDYRLGLLKLIPFRIHLLLDLLAALALLASPWLLGFAEEVWVPHVVLGALAIGVVLLSRRTDDTLPAPLRD